MVYFRKVLNFTDTNPIFIDYFFIKSRLSFFSANFLAALLLLILIWF